MKSYMKWIQERPLPLFVRDMQARYATPIINPVTLSRVALKVKRWIDSRPPNERNDPILAVDAAHHIRETVTSVGLALSELGYVRRRGGRLGDSILYLHRRVWYNPRDELNNTT